MRYDAARLYRIETNVGYVWRPVAEPVPPGVLGHFGLAPAGRIAELAKPSPTSRLFRVQTDTGRFMVRAAAAEHRAALEQQARIANDVGYERVVRPLRAGDGRYVALAGGQAWIAYPERAGELFTGANCALDSVVAEALALLAALRELEPHVEVTALETVTHSPGAWPDFVASAPEELPSLPAGTREMLASNRAELVDLADRLASLVLRPALVHDDLNHANVLVCDGAPYFLDLEDIRLESPEVAAAHAVFKLLRHAAYTGARTPDSMRRETVPRAVGLLARSGIEIGDAGDLFAFGAYRILSEIYDIATTGSGLYDLEKKVANLFELYDLLSERDGPSARG